jgi:hypothetical protein
VLDERDHLRDQRVRRAQPLEEAARAARAVVVEQHRVHQRAILGSTGCAARAAASSARAPSVSALGRRSGKKRASRCGAARRGRGSAASARRSSLSNSTQHALARQIGEVERRAQREQLRVGLHREARRDLHHAQAAQRIGSERARVGRAQHARREVGAAAERVEQLARAAGRGRSRGS